MHYFASPLLGTGARDNRLDFAVPCEGVPCSRQKIRSSGTPIKLSASLVGLSLVAEGGVYVSKKFSEIFFNQVVKPKIFPVFRPVQGLINIFFSFCFAD